MKPYRITLPVFEGPMDLLLYLIRKSELDIYDIPIAIVTDQYLEYLNMMRLVNVSLASEFLVMAATLMFIKSRMLLPQVEEEEEEPPLEDPRAPLVQQLLEYQQFKEIAMHLEERATAEENIFSRWIPLELLDEGAYEEHEEYDLFDLFKYFSSLIDQAEEAPFEVARVVITVEEKREEILSMLKTHERVELLSYVEGKTKQELVAIFLAILDLVKYRRIKISQIDPFGPIEMGLRS